MTRAKVMLLPVLLATTSILSGCVSTNPRPYAPIVEPPPNDQAVFQADFSLCASAVAAGRQNFRRSGGAVAVGVVGGVGVVQVAGAAALGAGGTTLAATGVGLVVVVPLATYGLTSARRAKNEREIQNAMTECLAERGHTVASWTRVSRGDTTLTVTPTRRARAS